jgi:TonB family protein
LLWAVIVCVVASPTPMRAQTTAAAPIAGGELVPFWLVTPAYPPIAQAARVQGVVIVALTVAADGRVQSATIERGVPLLSHDVLAAARDSGFICRGCTGTMPYRLEYHFQFADSMEQAEAVRAVINSTWARLPIVALPRVIDTVASGPGARSGSLLRHAEQEP